MGKHFLKYWLYSAVERQMASPHRLINYTASDQYRRVEVGDHLWFVTMPPKTQTLFLFGGMTVGWLGDRVEAARQLGTHPDALRSADLHILSDPDSTEPHELIDITAIAMDLRFDSTLGKDRLPDRSWPQALQTMRLLAPQTVTVLRDVWYSSGANFPFSPDPFLSTSLLDNRRRLEIHHDRERNPVHVAAAQHQFRHMHGNLFCEACGFDFSAFYGETGDDFMEVHHKQPFIDIEDDDAEVLIEDFAIVCANCHRMLHRHKPWLTVEQLHERLQTKK